MTTQRIRTSAITAIALTAALFLGGCAAATTNDNASTEMTGTESTDSATQTESPEASEDSATSDAMASLPDWTVGAPNEGTDAYLAWEALMGPEGEYAALASYQAVLDEFGDVEPYATIKDAEARHADALARQLERMGVEVPDNPYLGLIPAPADLQSAATAWAEGEVANVELYDSLLEAASDERLERVFTNLRRASAEEHLPAFELAAENGGTLDPSEMPRFSG